MRKTKKFLALLTALSLTVSTFAGLTATVYADGEVNNTQQEEKVADGNEEGNDGTASTDPYYTQDFETATVGNAVDTSGTAVSGDKQAGTISLADGTQWVSTYGAGYMSIAEDTSNSSIGKYAQYYLSTYPSGGRGAVWNISDSAKTLDSENRTVFEMDFFMSGGAGSQIVLGDTYGTSKTNTAITGDYVVALYYKDTNVVAINTLDGSTDTEVTEGYTAGTWAHLKSVLNFDEKTVVLSITSLDGQTTYLEETKVSMGGTSHTSVSHIGVYSPRTTGNKLGIDNVVFRPYVDGDVSGVYYMATFEVDGTTTTKTADKTTGLIDAVPDTTKTGYLFKGWYKDDDTETLISTEDVLATALTADVKYTACFEKDPDYIEPLASVEFASFPTNNTPEAGADENTAADNIISLKLTGEIGTDLLAEPDARVTDLDVEWNFKGFRHIASKAADGENAATSDAADSNEYCDSYAEVVYDDADPTTVNFKLKSQAFNFYGEVEAIVTYNGTTMTISQPMAIVPTTTSEAGVFLPKAGYWADFSVYSDDMVGYQATTSSDNKSATDVVTGGWAAYGGNTGRGLYLASDDDTDGKYLKLKSTGTNSSSFAVNKLDSAPTGQVIITQDVRFYNNSSAILFKQDNPVTWSDNATSFSFNFTGTSFNINGGDTICDATPGVWYRIVLSADVTSKLCFAKVYDMDGTLLGESDAVAFVNSGSTAPLYLCYRTPDNSQGEMDFNNVKMYTPEITGDLTTTISNDTLVIPTDFEAKDGINYDSESEKVVVKADDVADGTTAVLVVATYKNDNISKIETADLTFTGGLAEVAMSVSGTAKLMVWDSLAGMKPVCNTKTLDGDSNVVANVATLTVDAKSTEGYNMIGAAEWSVVDEATGEASELVTIAVDEANSHNATLTVAKGAAAGTYNVTVTMSGKTKTIPVTVTGTQDSIKFTKSTSSIAIPIEEGASQTYEYAAIVVDSDNADLGKTVTLEMYDKNNVNPLANTDAISFNSETGVLTVTSEAKGSVIYIRATSTNSNDEPISRSLKITIHGLAFDFGSADDVVEGYTAVTPVTTYSEQAGYGIDGTATVGGEGSSDNADSDYLSGSFTFKAKVTPATVYNVTVTYSGSAVSEKVNADLTGVAYTNSTLSSVTYEIPVIDDILDLTFTDKVASIVIEKAAAKSAGAKPNIYTIGDSTIANNGSWAYVMARDFATYTDISELPNIVTFSSNGRGGKNLSTYYTGGELRERVLANIRPGDYVMIGDMGTNGMGSAFEESFNYYIDACEALGAKVILNSYTPHGAVGDYSSGYDSTTQTFTSYRQDAYDVTVRAIYAERSNKDGEKYDEDIVGFVDIGKMADAAFNAYVDDYEANDYESRDEAAQAIIKCFGDHNHYSNGTIAAELMIKGYGTGDAAKGIVKSLYEIISADLAE